MIRCHLARLLGERKLKIADVDPTNGRIVATHAARLATARAIGVTGDVTDASASFDGSADVSISVTVKSASTTVAGKVELATNAEAATGTDAARAVTPAAMKSVTDTLATRENPTFTGTVTAPAVQAGTVGAPSTFSLNPSGGGVSLGNASSQIASDGVILGNINDLVNHKITIRDQLSSIDSFANNLKHMDVGQRL
jgi:hypothetical protein